MACQFQCSTCGFYNGGHTLGCPAGKCYTQFYTTHIADSPITLMVDRAIYEAKCDVREFIAAARERAIRSIHETRVVLNNPNYRSNKHITTYVLHQPRHWIRYIIATAIGIAALGGWLWFGH